MFRKNLPLEIWLYIAEFIPPHDLVKLVSVNRVFFHMIMNELYGELSFISADPRIFVDKLRTLQTPSLASRVRKLTIWPAAIREAIRSLEPVEVIKPPTPSAPTSPRYRTFKKGTLSLKQPSKFDSVTILPLFQDFLRKVPSSPKKSSSSSSSSSPTASTSPKKPTLPKPEKRLEMFLEALRALDKVEELEINWSIDKGHKDRVWKFGFFNDVWQNIGSASLRRLSIEVKLSKMQDVIISVGVLANVEELTLTLRNDVGDSRVDDNVVPDFVNKMKPTLRSLSIKTIGHQQLSFFGMLGEFPKLRKVGLSIPLDSYHLSDVNGFRAFFNNHPTIQDLELRYMTCCREELACDGFSSSSSSTHRLYSNLTLPALQNLKLGLRLPIPLNRSSRPESSPFLRSIANLNTSLVSLTLIDRSLSLDEVKSVVPYFAGSGHANSLRKLSLFAKNLSPQLIDVLARTFPGLGSLALDVQNVIKSESSSSSSLGGNAGPVGPSSPSAKDSDVVGFVQALFGYAVDLDNDRWRYKSWSLTDISVMRWAFGVGHGYDYECMKAIAYAVPTVRSFAGKGDMTERKVGLEGGEGEGHGQGRNINGKKGNGKGVGGGGGGEVTVVRDVVYLKPGMGGRLLGDLGEKTKPLDF